MQYLFYMFVPSEIIIILSTIFIIVSLFAYFIYKNSIVSIYSFDVNHCIDDIFTLLKHSNKYYLWWGKINNLYIYKINTKISHDSNYDLVRILINIKSTNTKEIWNILLFRVNSGTKVKVSQNLKELSFTKRILKNTWLYKSDIKNFKKSLLLKLKTIKN